MDEMTCVGPQGIQDWEIDAYLEGNAPAHLLDHLNRCPACRLYLAERVALERELQQLFFRMDCPSVDLLREYHWGYLSSDESQRIEMHLLSCPHCRAELSEFDSEKPLTSIGDSILNLVRGVLEEVPLVIASLVSPGGGLAPALRGEKQEVLLFEAGNVAISVNLEQEDTGAYSLFGQVLSTTTGNFSGAYARLKIQTGESQPIRSVLDSNGGFVLTGLRSGIYQLVVSLPGKRIIVPFLELSAKV